jgi:hypothetical protein
MNDLAHEAEAVFLAALDRATSPEREAYAQQACASRPELLQRVRELLTAHRQSWGPLDAPPPGLEGTAGLPGGPDADVIEELAFTPDGDRLLVRRQGNSVRVWDLRRIREQLAEAGLDRDRPPYPPAPPRGDGKPLRSEVDAP